MSLAWFGVASVPTGRTSTVMRHWIDILPGLQAGEDVNAPR
jgi:hypothetical protein